MAEWLGQPLAGLLHVGDTTGKNTCRSDGDRQLDGHLAGEPRLNCFELAADVLEGVTCDPPA